MDTGTPSSVDHAEYTRTETPVTQRLGESRGADLCPGSAEGVVCQGLGTPQPPDIGCSPIKQGHDIT